jgi:large subunit ribosomal protein L4
VIDSIDLAAPKTKEMVALLVRFKLANVLVVDDKSNANLALACRNLPNVTVVPAEGVNVYDILRRDHLVLTKSSAEALGQRLGG